MKLSLCSLLIFFIFSAKTMVHALSPRPEEDLRAAYVYQFLSYITWPNGTGQEILIGVWENDVMLKSFEKLLSERKNPDRAIRAIAISGELVPTEVDVIFAEKLRPSGFELLVKSIEQRKLLVISPYETHYRRGASILLFSESGKLRFSVDRTNLEMRDFKISSQLLRLAKKVD